jgi:opacity protein-like surface antigen
MKDRIVKAGALFTAGLLVQLSFAAASFAEPKQGSGGKCSCMCIAPSGIGGELVSDVTYDSQGYSCNSFEGKTCNLNNPYTGGVSTGSLIGCGAASGSSAARGITVLPAGNATIAPANSPPPRTSTPKAPITGVKK